MEWPKRARTADWENGVLTLDREKRFEIPELTMELMERLDGWQRVGLWGITWLGNMKPLPRTVNADCSEQISLKNLIQLGAILID